MSIDQHVRATLRINSQGLARQGFGMIGILTYKQLWADTSRTYKQLADAVADGFPADSPEALAIATILKQNPRVPSVKVLRGTRPPTQKYALGLNGAVKANFAYKANVKGEGVTATAISYTTKADLDFADADVTPGTDTIHEVGHGELTGNGPYRVKNVGGALPTGLAADTNVWLIRDDDDNYKLATSKANALANVAIDITAAAGGGVHTLLRAANDVVIAQWVDQLNAVAGKNFTAAQIDGAGDTDTLEVTADDPGDWFSIEVLDTTAMSIAQTHVDPGIAADLADIQLADPDWNYLHTNYNSSAMVLAGTDAIEAMPFKFYIVDVVDSAAENTAQGGGDVIDQWKATGSKRSLVVYHRKPNEMFAAGAAGRVAPLNVGTWTLAYKPVVGATADKFTATQIANLDAKLGSYYKAEAGRSFLWEGKVANTDYGFLDVTVSLDFILDGLQKAILGVLVARDKTAYTDEDIKTIESAAQGFLDLCTTDKYKIIARGTPGDPNDPAPTVTWPRVRDIDPAVRQLRNLPDGAASFRLQSAVHTVDVTVDIGF